MYFSPSTWLNYEFPMKSNEFYATPNVYNQSYNLNSNQSYQPRYDWTINSPLSQPTLKRPASPDRGTNKPEQAKKKPKKSTGLYI